MHRRSSRPWSALLLLAACADYERPERACDRLGLLCVQESAGLGLGLARSKGATGDLDGDDFRDLVSASGDGLSLLWGHTSTREYRLIAGGVAGVKLGDVDGDGDLDVVYVTSEPASLRVLENRGARELADGPTLPLVGRAESLWLGRLDSDDSLDAIVGGSDGGRISVLTDGLTKTTSIAAGRDLAAVEAGDLDGDGRLDIVAADRGDAAVHVVLAQGGGFASPRRISTGVAPAYLQLYDLDGDDRLDILTHGDGREIWLHANTGAGEFAAPRGLIVQDEPSPGFGAHRDEQGRRWLITADGTHATASELDETDAVVRRSLARSSSRIDGLEMDAGAPLTHGALYDHRLSLESSHVFTELWHEPNDVGEAITIADVDLDGALDLVTARAELVVRRGLGDASWGEPWTLSLPEAATSLAVADVTGDAVPDLVIGDKVPSLYVAIGAGDGTFTPGPPVPLPGAPGLLYAGLALPGEAAAVAVGSPVMTGVMVLRFDATGAVIEQTGPLGADPARTLTGTDIDADGDEDLVALTHAVDGASTLLLVPRDDDGWGAPRTRALESPPEGSLLYPGLALGDADLDGRTDAVIVANDVVVRLLDFAAESPPPQQIDPVVGVAGADLLALADIDGDGPPDLVVCSQSGLQSVLLLPDGAPQPQVRMSPGVRGCSFHVDPDSRQATAALTLRGRGAAVFRSDFAPALLLTDGFSGGPDRLQGLATGDLDADGHTDIIVGDESSVSLGTAVVVWGAADGQPRRATAQQPAPFGPGALAVAPLDDQPGDEVVVAGAGEAQIWTHADSGLRPLPVSARDVGYSYDVGVQTRADGRSDVIVLGNHFDDSGLTLRALPRGDDGGFLADGAVVLWTWPSVHPGAALTITDLDVDGFDDIAVLVGGYPNTPRTAVVVWGDEGRTGEFMQFGLTSTNIHNIASGDLAGDGAPELIFGGDYGVIAYTFTGRELTATNVVAQGEAKTLLVADLEADGHADLLRVDGDNLDIVLRSSGDDALANLELAGPWTELRAAHLDGDEILDLLGLQDGTLVTRLSAGAATPE